MHPQSVIPKVMVSSPAVLSVVIAVSILSGHAVARQQHVHNAGLPHDVPDFAANPTTRAVRSGAWSAAATWSAGRVPGANDVVRIPAGVGVTYDVVGDSALESVVIEGSLTFRTDVGTRLMAAVVEVMPSGRLEIGREGAPVDAGVTAEIVLANRPLDLKADPGQYGTALIGLGMIRMHGAVVEPTFTRVADEALAGQTTLRLQAASTTGWQSARLVLPGTSQVPPSSSAHPESEELVAASATGAQVGLAAPLAFNHRGARDLEGKLSFLPHVGNLSRNVVIRSEDPKGTRGHVIFVHRADVDIRYSLFKDLGRTTTQRLNPTTNHIGRYSLHMHHVFGPAKPQPNGHQFTLIGNAIDGGSKWGITVHDSHYGLIRDNVVYDTRGAGIMTEDGSETGNVFDHNFVVRTSGTGSLHADERRGDRDWGHEGSSFWFRGPSNYVRNNVGANATSYAASYMMVDVGDVEVPSKQGSTPGKNVNMMAMPLLEFSNNEFYASPAGLTIWNLGANCCTEVYDVPVSKVTNTAMWHLGLVGYSGYASNRLEFDGWIQRGDPKVLATPHSRDRALEFGDYLVRNTVIRNADIQGLRYGIVLPSKVGDTRDIYGRKPGTVVIENGILRNVVNVSGSTMYGVTGGGDALPARVTTIRGVRFGRVGVDVGGASEYDVLLTFDLESGPNPNVVVADEVWIYDYNGTTGDSFRVYYKEQAPSFQIPRKGSGVGDAPVAGLTNAESWSRYKVAIAGSVAPCTTQRAGFGGFTCSIK